jgi:hypothetical protein
MLSVDGSRGEAVGLDQQLLQGLGVDAVQAYQQ